MATLPSNTILERIAQLSGTTGQVAYDSGTFGDCIRNAKNILGNVKDWNVLTDEAGNVFSIAGKNGTYVQFESASGITQEYIAGNQLVTDAIYDAEARTITAQTGNIVDAAGSVTKKGLVATANVGAQVLSGVTTALGGVMLGVKWYEDNPEFWTEVSQKLLPFAYEDPTDKSWSNIFYDAFFPTATDSDGNTYVQAKDVEFIKNLLVNGNFFTESSYVQGNVEDWGENIKLPFISPVPPQTLFLDDISHKNPVTTPSEKYLFADYAGFWKFNYDTSGRGVNIIWKQTSYRDGQYIPEFYRGAIGILFPTKSNYTSVTIYTNGNSGYEDVTKNADSCSQNTGGAIDNPPGTYPVNFPYIELPFTLYNDGPNQNSDEFYDRLTKIQDLIRTGNAISGSQYDNTSLLPEAKYPTADTTIQDLYPDWWDKLLTTINPDWNPENGDDDKYIIWLPVQMPDTDNDGDTGNTQTDANQEDGQSGKPTENNNTGEKTDNAIDQNVLPDPYPQDKDDTGDSGNTGETPDPPVDPDPDPDKPVISGGSANALWKIYNPSLSVLQEFGKWLWSDKWTDLVKQLFANNPAEGIIGLHMIYATPVVGGTSNIVVGYLDSGVASNVVSQQYVTINCGSVTIPLVYNSALDFGYTKVYCYLPFIGIVQLDSYDVVGKTISIKYTVDVMTGIVLAQITVTLRDYSAILYTFNGSCSVEYPLTSGSRASQMLSLITGAVGGATVGGVGGAVIGAAKGALTGADVRCSGNLAGNAGSMGIRKPYLIVKRPVESAAFGYNEFYGYPANATYLLRSLSGYVRVKDVHVDNISNATQVEKNEIENLLKTGVIIQ